MQVDYEVEIGPDAPALELPWKSEDGAVRYFDLKADLALISKIPEAAGCPELAAFLSRINAAGFPLQTAKCDLWQTRELSDEERIFNAECKCGSYIDLLFAAEQPRFSLESHESLARELCALLRRAPETPASVEFVIRQCHYHSQAESQSSSAGFYVTAYVSGFDDDDEGSRLRWAIALKLVQHALVQWASR